MLAGEPQDSSFLVQDSNIFLGTGESVNTGQTWHSAAAAAAAAAAATAATAIQVCSSFAYMDQPPAPAGPETTRGTNPKSPLIVTGASASVSSHSPYSARHHYQQTPASPASSSATRKFPHSGAAASLETGSAGRSRFSGKPGSQEQAGVSRRKLESRNFEDATAKLPGSSAPGSSKRAPKAQSKDGAPLRTVRMPNVDMAKVEKTEAVKDIVDVFMKRQELIPTGETSEEHSTWRKEALESVERDKAGNSDSNRGLFRGCFRKRQNQLRAIRDEEDRVARCPRCWYELEDNICMRCQLEFDENGSQISEGFLLGFSDEEDEDSDNEISSEDLDGELDMEDVDADLDFQVWDDPMNEPFALDYPNEYDREHEIIHGNTPQPPVHRPAAHSAAGGRSRRYIQSATSDMQTSEDGEMGTLEEDSEEEETESMRGFIDDGSELSHEGDSTRDGSSQPPADTSQYSRAVDRTHSHPGRRRTQRLLVEDDDSDEEEEEEEAEEGERDDDFDEGGAVSNGRRRRLVRPALSSRRTGRRTSRAPSTSSETEAEEGEAFRNGWSPLDQGALDETMEDDETGIDSVDSATAGNERPRHGGSVTPSAEHSSPVIRHPRRFRNRLGSSMARGLRRRSSVVSVSTISYEDGEADDDDSDPGSMILDRDGDLNMIASSHGLQGRRIFRNRHQSQVHMRRPRQSSEEQSLAPRDAIDIDTDSMSDASTPAPRRRRSQLHRQEEYNPRISMIFAQHQLDMNGLNVQQSSAHPEYWDNVNRSRSSTPSASSIVRPRTSNRNRSQHQSSASSAMPAFMPQLGHPRPTMVPCSIPQELPSACPASTASTARASRSERHAARALNSVRPMQTRVPVLPNEGGHLTTTAGRRAVDHHDSVTSIDMDQIPRQVLPPRLMADSTPVRRSTTINTGHGNLDYPWNASTLFARSRGDWRDPPSNAADVDPSSQIYSPGMTLPTTTSSVHLAGSIQANPWAGHIARSRPSSNRLRETPSNATLRPRSSRRDMRSQPPYPNFGDSSTAGPSIRPTASRSSLRQAPSQQRLRTQDSVHAPRSGTPTFPSSSSLAGGGATGSGPGNPPLASRVSNRLSDEERRRRGGEVVRQRQEALMRQHSRPRSTSQTHPYQSNPVSLRENKATRPAPRSGVSNSTSSSVSPRGSSPTPLRSGHLATLNEDSRFQLRGGRRGNVGSNEVETNPGPNRESQETPFDTPGHEAIG
ncbi:MAG: hypothetical protein M1837_006783 [Sclerophora amabilis]|nr:MAG: hypothetical protein M1837_006783 [Sclerophora amabilis]